MSRDLDSNPVPITDRQQLLDYFRQGEKPLDARGIGTEHEKFVVRRDEGRMLSFDEPGGFADLFQALIDQFGWEAAPLDDGNIIAVTRNGSAITLEPGGQFELSGAITSTVFETAREFDDHLRELHEVADEDLRFVIWGLNPSISLDEVPWMPKTRYRIMREYMPTRGKLAHWMMKATCTIQANLDYTSEEDAIDLIHTAVLASPVVGALFANSPIQERKETGYQSRRNFIWAKHTDPDRSGVPSFMYRTDWDYETYLKYVLDVPMFFIRRDDGVVNMAGHSFREFMAKGYQGHRARMGDFELHLSTAFPDVRMKQFVEVRSADGGPRQAVMALPALWKGLLYDDQARQAVKDLFHPLDEEAHRELIEICYRDGIHGPSAYGDVADLAATIVEASRQGLDRLAESAGHDSEAIFLEPLEDRLSRRRSWADDLLEDFREVDGDLGELAERWTL